MYFQCFSVVQKINIIIFSSADKSPKADQQRSHDCQDEVAVVAADGRVAVVVLVAVARQHRVGAEQDVLALVLELVLGAALSLRLRGGLH